MNHPTRGPRLYDPNGRGHYNHNEIGPWLAHALLALRQGPAYPAVLADALGVSRQAMSNHLSCLRGCGLIVGHPDGRWTLYELADSRVSDTLGTLMDLVLVVDPKCCGGEHVPGHVETEAARL